MFGKSEELFFPSPINVDLTISRCKRKLANLTRYIKSTSNLRSHADLRYLRGENGYNTKSSKQVHLDQQEKYRDLEEHLDDKKISYKPYEQCEKRHNLETNVCPESDSESSPSYANSFVNKLIERYRSISRPILPDLDDPLETNSSHQIPKGTSSPKLRKGFEMKDDHNTNSREILNNIIGGSNLTHKLDKDCKNQSRKESLERQESSHMNMSKQKDLETKEIVDSLDKKICILEKNLRKDNKRKTKQRSFNVPQRTVLAEYLEWSNSIESKLLSISVIPPDGISCLESSFLPYYCNVQEIQVVKDLISIKGKIINSPKKMIEVINIGKMFCCHARARFINSIKRLHHVSPQILKLKILVNLEEPELLLANTFGQDPVESKSDIRFYELEALYEVENLSRFLICLLITDKPADCLTKRCYTISNTEQVLPIYIINLNSISS